MTEYMILRSGSNEQGEWAELTKETARSARAAIKQAAKRLGTDVPRNHFVAVPARSWNPVTVTTETKTQFKFS